MPAAIAIPLIVGAASAGAQVYGAHKAAGTAKDAARTQTKAGKQALGVQQQVYQDQQARQAPYMAAGLQGLSQAQGYAGTPAPTFTPGQTAQFRPPSPVPFDASAMQPLGRPAGPPPMPREGRATPGGPMTGGDVLLQSPDGEQRRVPTAQVPYFVSKGARVIG